MNKKVLIVVAILIIIAIIGVVTYFVTKPKVTSMVESEMVETAMDEETAMAAEVSTVETLPPLEATPAISAPPEVSMVVPPPPAALVAVSLPAVDTPVPVVLPPVVTPPAIAPPPVVLPPVVTPPAIAPPPVLAPVSPPAIFAGARVGPPPPATECPGSDCTIEEQMCLPGTMGAGPNTYKCINKKWVQQNTSAPTPTPLVISVPAAPSIFVAGVRVGQPSPDNAISLAQSQYTFFKDNDIPGNDIRCINNPTDFESCRVECNRDPNCKAYNHVYDNGVWGAGKWGCCLKTPNTPPTTPTPKIDYFLKKETAASSEVQIRPALVAAGFLGNVSVGGRAPQTPAPSTILETFAVGGMNASPIRYIRLGRRTAGVVNIAEIEAFDSNNNLITFTQAVYGPIGDTVNGLSGFSARNAADRNFNNFAHTNDNNMGSFLQVGFDSEVNVSKIVITNRKDCCQDRMRGTYISFLRGDGATEATPTIPIDAVSKVYSFEFNPRVEPSTTATLVGGGTSTATTSGGSVQATSPVKFVRLGRRTPGIINIAEIQAYDINNNLIRSTAIYGPSGRNADGHSSFGPELANDGNLNNFAHTLKDNSFIQLILPTSISIAKLVITNRKDGSKDRMVGTKVEFFDESGAAAAPSINIDDIKDTYTFQFRSIGVSNIFGGASASQWLASRINTPQYLRHLQNKNYLLY